MFAIFITLCNGSKPTLLTVLVKIFAFCNLKTILIDKIFRLRVKYIIICLLSLFQSKNDPMPMAGTVFAVHKTNQCRFLHVQYFLLYLKTHNFLIFFLKINNQNSGMFDLYFLKIILDIYFSLLWTFPILSLFSLPQSQLSHKMHNSRLEIPQSIQGYTKHQIHSTLSDKAIVKKKKKKPIFESTRKV